jgi:nucleoside-diphosphate-sugar epimerase
MKFAVLSLDVEDWYHLDYFRDSACDRNWSLLDGLDNYNEILENHKVPSSYFVLGELAKKLRAPLRAAAAAGNDVGSHGWNHEHPLRLTADQFATDLHRAKGELEDSLGRPVSGYRAPCFGLDRPRLEQVRSARFDYDSSRIQFKDHALYGSLDLTGYDQISPNIFRQDDFFEFQVSTLKMAGRNIPVSGGGYLRIIPWMIMKKWIDAYLDTNELYVLYIHPFELSRRSNPPLPAGTRFKTRLRFEYGRFGVGRRLSTLIDLLKRNGFEFTTFARLREKLLKESPGAAPSTRTPVVELRSPAEPARSAPAAGARRILITGGSGFIGQRLVQALTERGDEVWRLDRLSNGEPRTLKADLLDAAQTRKALADQPPFHAVIHLAALTHGRKPPRGETLFSANVGMTRNLVDAIADPATHFLYFSSVAVYGEAGRRWPIGLDADLRPSTEYGRSKRECESLLIKSPLKNIDILRLTPVFDEQHLRDVRKRVFVPGLQLKVQFSPEPRHSLAHVQNVVQEVMKVLDRGPQGWCLHQIADPKAYGQGDLARQFEGPSITIQEPLLRPVYWCSFMLPGSRGYALRCLYSKLIHSNTYLPGSMMRLTTSPPP